MAATTANYDDIVRLYHTYFSHLPWDSFGSLEIDEGWIPDPNCRLLHVCFQPRNEERQGSPRVVMLMALTNRRPGRPAVSIDDAAAIVAEQLQIRYRPTGTQATVYFAVLDYWVQPRMVHFYIFYFATRTWSFIQSSEIQNAGPLLIQFARYNAGMYGFQTR